MTIDELVTEILKSAKDKGIYRQKILDKYYGLLPKKEIEHAITLARQSGMYSIPDMRHYKLGTYYQYDGEVK